MKILLTVAAGFNGSHLAWFLLARLATVVGLDNLNAYIDSNIVGFTNILEGCCHTEVKHLISAPRSSVYGGITVITFSEHH